MTVIVANDTPDAIRGMLKRWFIEPRPNVFVGTLNRRTHEKTIEYIKRNAAGIGLLIVSSYPNCQGYVIESSGRQVWLFAKMSNRLFGPCILGSLGS